MSRREKIVNLAAPALICGGVIALIVDFHPVVATAAVVMGYLVTAVTVARGLNR